MAPSATASSSPPCRRRFDLPLPADEADEMARRLEFWRRDLRPEGLYHEWVLRLLVIATLRLDRDTAHESALLNLEAHRALLRWDDDRRLQAEELGNRLARNPAVISRKLAATLQGGHWLMGRWQALASLADSGTPWDDAQRSLAFDLLGVAPDGYLRGCRASFDPEPGSDRPAAAVQAALARREIDRLETACDTVLGPLDAEEHELAEAGLWAAPSREVLRLCREQARWMRLFSWAMGELRRARSSESLPSSPTSGRFDSRLMFEPPPPRPEPPAAALRTRPEPLFSLDDDGPEPPTGFPPADLVAAGLHGDDVVAPAGRTGLGADLPRALGDLLPPLPPSGNRQKRRAREARNRNRRR
jgi:hypothetical protein